MASLGNIGGRLYRGDVSVNFVSRQRMWYTISGIILLISVVALLVRGLNFSVDFKGGAEFSFHDPAATSQQIAAAVTAGGGGAGATIQQAGAGSSSTWQVQTKTLSSSQSLSVANSITHALGLTGKNVPSTTFVGPSWGSSISHKAIEALIVFLILVVIYLSIAFEWKMSVSAFVALLHDIVITTGVYALTGFQVSPATIIGLLTILGYSLYDTVVVFDKVRENTAGILTTQRSTYSQAANLALNQTLVRSINTSLIALLPVGSILFIGAGLLGAGTLKDLALVLFVGMLSGTYSSICIATPVLADLKEREPRYQALAKRVQARSSGGRAARRAAARAGAGVGSVGAAGVQAGPAGPASAAEPAGFGSTVTEAAPEDDADDAVDVDDGTDDTGEPVSQAARPVQDGTRSVSRQQPRRSSAAQRRPGSSGRGGSGARKKRR